MVWKHLTNTQSCVLKRPIIRKWRLFRYVNLKMRKIIFPAEHSEIPVEHAILGIDAIQLRVNMPLTTKQPLVDYLHWHEKETVPF